MSHLIRYVLYRGAKVIQTLQRRPMRCVFNLCLKFSATYCCRAWLLYAGPLKSKTPLSGWRLYSVSKYCDEHVCVSVCVCLSVREDIFWTTRAIFIILYMLPTAVARSSSSGRVTKFHGEGEILFFPTDDALCSIAFETHTKTVEPIEMPFGMMRNSVTWGWRSPKGKGQFWGKHVPDKRNTSNNCELDWSSSGSVTKSQGQAAIVLFPIDDTLYSIYHLGLNQATRPTPDTTVVFAWLQSAAKCGIAHRGLGRSLISTIALIVFVAIFSTVLLVGIWISAFCMLLNDIKRLHNKKRQNVTSKKLQNFLQLYGTRGDPVYYKSYLLTCKIGC